MNRVSLRVHHALAIVISLFLVTALSGCPDFNLWNSPVSSGVGENSCCPYDAQDSQGTEQHYLCQVAIYPNHDPKQACWQPQAACGATQAAALAHAIDYLATSHQTYDLAPDALQLATECKARPCAPGEKLAAPLPNDFSACVAIVEVDAGPPPACLDVAATCAADTDCCSGICSDHEACETCRIMAEGCVLDSECCSGVCALNACGG